MCKYLSEEIQLKNKPLPEDKEGYIEQRLQGQMDYYHTKCLSLKKEYYCLSILNIIVTALIPIFTLAVENCIFCKYIIVALGAAASIFTSILLLHKTKETQLSFRSTYEALKREQVFYLNQVGDYMETEPEKRATLFIDNCEKIMMNEQKTWIEQRQDKN